MKMEKISNILFQVEKVHQCQNFAEYFYRHWLSKTQSQVIACNDPATSVRDCLSKYEFYIHFRSDQLSDPVFPWLFFLSAFPKRGFFSCADSQSGLQFQIIVREGEGMAVWLHGSTCLLTTKKITNNEIQLIGGDPASSTACFKGPRHPAGRSVSFC